MSRLGVGAIRSAPTLAPQARHAATGPDTTGPDGTTHRRLDQTRQDATRRDGTRLDTAGKT